MRVALDLLLEGESKARLSDAWLSVDQCQLAVASLGLVPASLQQPKFLFAADELGRFRMQCFEAALDRTWPPHRESFHRPRNPLELLWPEVLQLEKIAKEPARALRYDYHVRLGDALKACGEVRRLAYNIVLLRFAGPHKIPDHHHPSGSPYPHL